MKRLSKAARQQIVQDFARRHSGQYDAALFLQEVQAMGPSHPAYDWFEWDAGEAARLYQIEQAREFVRDLRVTFTIQEIGGVPIRVRMSEMPLVMSPLDQRLHGGGYILTDPTNPAHMAEHCLQAIASLESWLKRYRQAVEHNGGSVAVIEDQIRALRSALEQERVA